VVHSPDTDFIRPVSTSVVTGFVDIPFRKLFVKLAPTVQSAPHHLPESDDALFQIPLSIICEQLPRGAIKLTFSDFRKFSPAGVFPANGLNEDAEITLPLSEIVPCIKPGQLPRRQGQRQVQVPQDIAPLFGPDGRPVTGLKVCDEKKSAAPVTPKQAAHSAPAAANAVPAASPIPQAVYAPSPFSASIPAAPVAPVPVSAIAPISAIASAGDVPVSHEPIRAPKLDPALATLKPKIIPTAAPAVAPARAAQPAAPATSKAAPQGNFHIALMDLSAHWTAAGKEELAALYKHAVEIPMERVEAGLKRGKLVFPWREIKPWLKFAAGNALPDIDDEYEVDLPLHIIAPRYLQEKTPGKAGKKVLPGDDIPDVFDIRPADIAANEAAAATVVTPMAAAPQPVIVAPAAAAEVALESPAPNRLFEYGEIFGQPDKKSWTLGEVAQKCSTLRGVEGALIGDGDGLLIAGNWNGDVPPESVAAFLPQMFRRVMEYSVELQLGGPNNFILMVENVPLQIFKAGSNYLAVLGKAGESLPKAQLSAIAKRLAQTGK